MRTLRRRTGRPVAAAASTALLLALTACGGDGSDDASDEPSISESSAATDTGDQPAEGEEVEPADFVADMKTGLENSTTAQMTMTMNAGGAAIDAEGDVDYTTTPPGMAMTMTNQMMGNQQIELRLVDGVMYMNMGSMSNNKFVAYDLSDTGNLPPGIGGMAEQMDPLAAFEQVEPALKSVTFVGEENVDGEDLAHYDLVLDTSKMESMQGLPAEAGLPKEIGYDMYFDDEFRIRQMNMTMDAAQPIDVEVTLSEWGEPVEIEAPPADDVVDPSTMGG